MNKLLYKPLGMLFGVLGGLAASAAFKKVWQLALRRRSGRRFTGGP